MEAKFKSVRNLFAGRRAAKFVVPEYQRGYEWNKKNFEDLWGDLQRIGDRVNKHYIGNIILLGEESDEELEIVDGQQRMVTISILTMAIRDSHNMDKSNHQLIDDVLTSYPSNNPERKLNLYDEEADRYYENLWEGNIDEIGGNIETAYQFYRQKVNDFEEEELNKLLRKLTNDLRVVETTSQDTSLAYMIFQSQNERGVEVSPEVLIKARVFGEAERMDDLQRTREMKGKWKQMYKTLNDNLERPRFPEEYRVRRPLTQLLINSDTPTPREVDKSALYRTFDGALQDAKKPLKFVDRFHKKI
ncbi:DUF262 domain-containing protein [Salinilacihabitans rarus]|uniref:DUF262 domain-containing protein n=1 Tax=Salinilacihabitans rarus TaxID=2961596 RepID=UPI0020C8BA05|nr:DUF262 domain-containing protein [Salinilacihabitans rarus]